MTCSYEAAYPNVWEEPSIPDPTSKKPARTCPFALDPFQNETIKRASLDLCLSQPVSPHLGRQNGACVACVGVDLFVLLVGLWVIIVSLSFFLFIKWGFNAKLVPSNAAIRFAAAIKISKRSHQISFNKRELKMIYTMSSEQTKNLQATLDLFGHAGTNHKECVHKKGSCKRRDWVCHKISTVRGK